MRSVGTPLRCFPPPCTEHMSPLSSPQNRAGPCGMAFGDEVRGHPMSESAGPCRLSFTMGAEGHRMAVMLLGRAAFGSTAPRRASARSLGLAGGPIVGSPRDFAAKLSPTGASVRHSCGRRVDARGCAGSLALRALPRTAATTDIRVCPWRRSSLRAQRTSGVRGRFPGVGGGDGVFRRRDGRRRCS
jgi:hypothetical protein